MPEVLRARTCSPVLGYGVPLAARRGKNRERGLEMALDLTFVADARTGRPRAYAFFPRPL